MEILLGLVDGVGPLLAERLWQVFCFVKTGNYQPQLSAALKKEFDATIEKIGHAQSDETQCRAIARSLLDIYKRSVLIEQPN